MTDIATASGAVPVRASAVWNVAKTAMWLVFALAAVCYPFTGSPTATDIGFRICTLTMLAISWNMMAGAGLISLGHSAFWGLGNYAAILTANSFGVSMPISLLPAIIAGALLGAAIALLTGRLQGIYFAICTLAASEGLRVLAVMLPDLTGGSNGLYLNTKLAASPLNVNLAAALGAILTALIAWAISRSRYQFALRAMRNNESASQMLGIEPLRYRVAIMSISGAVASFAGGINMWRGGYLDPSVAFDLLTTINSQIAPILGGIYTLPGPIIGAVAATGLAELTRALLGDYVGASLLVFGVLLVVIVLGLPNGIYGSHRRAPSRQVARRPSSAEKAR